MSPVELATPQLLLTLGVYVDQKAHHLGGADARGLFIVGAARHRILAVALIVANAVGAEIWGSVVGARAGAEIVIIIVVVVAVVEHFYP